MSGKCVKIWLPVSAVISGGPATPVANQSEGGNVYWTGSEKSCLRAAAPRPRLYCGFSNNVAILVNSFTSAGCSAGRNVISCGVGYATKSRRHAGKTSKGPLESVLCIHVLYTHITSLSLAHASRPPSCFTCRSSRGASDRFNLKVNACGATMCSLVTKALWRVMPSGANQSPNSRTPCNSSTQRRSPLSATRAANLSLKSSTSSAGVWKGTRFKTFSKMIPKN